MLLSRFSPVRLCVTLWTVGHQAPLSMGFSMQEYWSGLPGPPPGDLPDPGIEPMSLMSNLHWQAGSFTTTATREAHMQIHKKRTLSIVKYQRKLPGRSNA